MKNFFLYLEPMPLNVLGDELECCCKDPLTGFHRDGFCRTGEMDTGRHVICAQVTSEFQCRGARL